MHSVIVEKRQEEYRDATEDDVWTGTAHAEGDQVFVSAGGWFVFCEDCGWHANNPHEDEPSAKHARRYHEITAEMEDERARAIADARDLPVSHDTGWAAAAMLYNRASEGVTEKVREIV